MRHQQSLLDNIYMHEHVLKYQIEKVKFFDTFRLFVLKVLIRKAFSAHLQPPQYNT